MNNKVLEVNDLTVSFRTNNGMVRAVRGVSFDLNKGETLAIVGESGSGKSVSIRSIMGILAGNSVIDKGSIIYEGKDLTTVGEEDFHEIRGNKIGMIFQDPMSSLNPIMRVGKQLTEGMLLNGNKVKREMSKLTLIERTKLRTLENESKILKKNLKNAKKQKNNEDVSTINDKINELAVEIRSAKQELKLKKFEAKATVLTKINEQKEVINDEINELKEKMAQSSPEENKKIKVEISDKKEAIKRLYKVTKKEAYERAIQVMNEVGIPQPEQRFKQYPFQFSGGMRQRIVIAIALTTNPDILICDEPTTALDVTIQAQILELINDLKREREMSVIFITHDLGVVANMADRVAVMYAGKIVEKGSAEDIFYNPKHPYTWALLGSMPDLESKEKLEAIPGTPPNMIFPPKGDAFAARNKYAMKIDFEEQPPMFKVSDTHYAATWLLHEDAPKIEMPKVIAERIQRMKQLANEVIEDGK